MKTGLKLAVTLLILFFLVRMADPAQLSGLLARVDAGWIAVALGVSVLNVFLDAALFCNVMAAQGRCIQYNASLAYSVVGWFFGNLAPSSVGADLFRTAQMRRLGVPTASALRVVLNYRLMSFLPLIVLILVGAPFGFPYLVSPADKIALALVLAGGVAAVGCALLVGQSETLQSLAARFRPLTPLVVLARDLANVALSGPRRASSWAFALAQHLVRLLVLAALARALQLDVPFAVLFAFAPVSLLIAMIPISFGNWGVREASFVYFLGLAGVPLESALYLSVVYGLTRLFLGAVGGLFWVVARNDIYRLSVRET